MTMYYTYLKRNRRRYFIENEKGQPVAWFDDMDTAATVLRYLIGAPMQPEDMKTARNAMIAFDARKEGEDH